MDEEIVQKAGTPVRHICLPAELSDNVYPPEYSALYMDGLLDPIRLPKTVLNNKREELGPFGYAGQYEQRPVPLSGGMFHSDKVGIELAPPAKFEALLRFWDKAATADGDGAYTAGVKMGRTIKGSDKYDFWILDVVRGRWDAFTRERIIRQVAELDGKGVRIGMEQEPGSGGKESALNTIRNLAGFRVYAERATGDKCERATPFASQVNGGFVAAVKAPWTRAYIDEMKNFGPLAKYKDQIDASSGAFNFLANRKKPAGGGGF